MNNSLLIQEFRGRLRDDFLKLDALFLEPLDVKEVTPQLKKVKQSILHLTNLLKMHEDLKDRE